MYTLLFIYLVLGLGIACIRIFGFRFIWRERSSRAWLAEVVDDPVFNNLLS
jgi:hypothetical protein